MGVGTVIIFDEFENLKKEVVRGQTFWRMGAGVGVSLGDQETI